MLSREEVLGRGLDKNLGDGEEKGDVFGEALDLAAQDICDIFVLCGRYCENIV